MTSEYLDSSHKVNTGTGDYVLCSVNRRDELLEYMNKASPQLYGDRTPEVYEHILNGILGKMILTGLYRCLHFLQNRM